MIDDNFSRGASGRAPVPAKSSPDWTQDTVKTPGDARENVSETVRELADKTSDQIRETAGDLADKAQSMAAQQKDLVAEHLHGLSKALDKVATELRQENATSAAYVRTVSDSVSSLTRHVSEKDVGDLWSMAQDFGRRQPAAFMSLAAVLGFAASRFLMSSENRSESGTHQPANPTGALSPATSRPSERVNPVTASPIAPRRAGEFERHIAQPARDVRPASSRGEQS